MGAPNDQYIVAATLFDHPGISLPDLVERLNKVEAGNYPSSGGFPMWRSIPGIAIGRGRFHTGILGVSKYLLRLSRGDEREFNDWCENLGLPRLEITPRKERGIWIPPAHIVNLPNGSSRGRRKIETVYSSKPFKEGEEINLFNSPHERRVLETVEGNIFEETLKQSRWKVLEIKSCNQLTKEEAEKLNLAKGQKQPLKYQLVIREIIPKGKRFEFDTLEDLVRAFPEYSPEKLFDYSQEHGYLETYHSSCLGSPRVSDSWIMRNGGYYLNLTKMIEEGREQDFTSMVLTAEAIRKGEWEVLEYCSGEERPGVVADFLVRNPDSNRRHKDAIIYFRSAYDALKRGLTNIEWLRERCFTFRPLDDEAAGEEYRIVCEEAPALIKRRDERRAYERRAIRERDSKGELPF